MNHSIRILQIGALILSLFACKQEPGDMPSQSQATDPHSFSRPDEVIVRHLNLDVTVDFMARQISGRASLAIANKTGARQLILDSRDLRIERVTLDDAESETTFRLGEPQPYLGQALTITISPETKVVHIYYATSPQAAALQWLTPEQTAGKKHPFLFTQSQAILARTWVPCQDSPGVPQHSKPIPTCWR